MLITGREPFTPENYKDYKNRTMDKLRNRINDLFSAINQCSLKGEDKTRLKKEIMDKILNNK